MIVKNKKNKNISRKEQHALPFHELSSRVFLMYNLTYIAANNRKTRIECGEQAVVEYVCPYNRTLTRSRTFRIADNHTFCSKNITIFTHFIYLTILNQLLTRLDWRAPARFNLIRVFFFFFFLFFSREVCVFSMRGVDKTIAMKQKEICVPK